MYLIFEKDSVNILKTNYVFKKISGSLLQRSANFPTYMPSWLRFVYSCLREEAYITINLVIYATIFDLQAKWNAKEPEQRYLNQHPQRI